MKKIISIILSIGIMLSMVAVPGYAESGEVIYVDSVEELE